MIVYYIRADGSIIEDHHSSYMALAEMEVRKNDPRLTGIWLRLHHATKVVFIEGTLETQVARGKL